MIAKGGYMYIMMTENNTVPYVGASSELKTRVFKHKTKFYPNSFTAKYNITKLVHYEFYDDIEIAIAREKAVKNWKHDWKIELIKSKNPEFKDLYDELEGD